MTKASTETMAISEFKATCLSVLERVRRTGRPIVVTRRGVPIAEITPPQPAHHDDGWMGSRRGTATILGDVVSPIGNDDWEVLGS
jgi:prevent-host-death family protein